MNENDSRDHYSYYFSYYCCVYLPGDQRRLPTPSKEECWKVTLWGWYWGHMYHAITICYSNLVNMEIMQFIWVNAGGALVSFLFHYRPLRQLSNLCLMTPREAQMCSFCCMDPPRAGQILTALGCGSLSAQPPFWPHERGAEAATQPSN